MSETFTSTLSHVLEDPSAQAVARVYALAFLNGSRSAGVDNPLEEITSFQDDVLNRNPDYADLLMSGVLTQEDQVSLIEKTIQPVASPFFVNFLKVLAEHQRLNLFPLILNLAWLEQERRDNRQRVTVKSAVPLNESQLNSIKNRLQSALNSEPILLPVVDEKLIGGLVIQVGDTVYDGSLKSRLTSLRERLRKGYLHEIQSGRDRFSHPEGN